MKNRGFTLVELIASLALLAIIFIPVSKFFVDSFEVQARNQKKAITTRVGQYVVENFKNKNYLGFDFSDIRVKYEDGKPINEFDVPPYPYQKEIEYGNVLYDVKVTIGNKPIVSDTVSTNIPSSFDGKLTIDEYGIFSDNFSDEYNITTVDKGESFSNNGKNYVASKPTIILSNPYSVTQSYTLNINNEFEDDLTIGIVKNFDNNLKIYSKGKFMFFEDGAPGDGRTAEMARFETAYVGDTTSENISDKGELILYADIRITDTRDRSVGDIFSVTFPIDYDYYKSE